MKKKTAEAMPTEQNTSEAKEIHTPAEMEADKLRIELNNERIKVNALSRRCIQLSAEHDAAIIAENNRIEQDMFDHINGNCYHKKAVTIASKRRNARHKKMAEFYSKALKKNAACLCGEVLITLVAILFGFASIIHSILAVILVVVSLIAFGWSLNNCVYLIGRCEQ